MGRTRRFFKSALFVLMFVLWTGVLWSAAGENATVYAADYEKKTADGIRYVDIGTDVTIVGYDGTKGNLVIPAQIDGKPVVRLENGAFEGNGVITSVEIPDEIWNIPDSAFYRCVNLKRVKLPKKLTYIGPNAFAGCSNLTDIQLPDGLKTICGFAFKDCVKLESIRIPASVEEYKHGIFNLCTRLRSVSLPANMREIPEGMFYGCTSLGAVEIPAAVRRIEESAFDGCINMTLQTGLPDGLTYIGPYSFNGCNGLTSVEMPDCVTEMGMRAFSWCENLRQIKLSNKLTVIPYQGFMFSGIEEIEFPSSVTKIDTMAFNKCNNLTYVHIPGNVKNVGSEAFNWSENLRKVDIDEGVEKIEICAFWGCTSLSEVSIPGTVSVMENSVFSNCHLTRVKIPEGVTKLCEDSFSLNEEMEYVELPRSLNEIEVGTFYGTPTFTYGVYKDSWAHQYCESRGTTYLLLDETSGGGSTDLGGVNGFVTRMYEVCLNREPDAAGLLDWTNRLKNRQALGADIAFGFIFSEEMANMNLCNEHFVDSMYDAFFGREADAAGKADWMNRLAQGQTRGAVMTGFVNSQEFANLCAAYGIAQGSGDWSADDIAVNGNCSICAETGGSGSNAGADRAAITAFVSRLYENCLGRAAEEAGLNSWVDALVNGAEGSQVAASFVFSEEYYQKNAADDQFVRMLYKTMLGREADAAGMTDWVSQLQGGASRESVFNGFAASQEFGNMCREAGINVGGVIQG